MDGNNEKRAAEHLDLYRYDGRSFEINEENGVLTLQLRRSILVERLIVSVLIAGFLTSLYVILAWGLRSSTTFSTDESQFVIGIIGATIVAPSLGVVGGSINMMRTGVVWKFEKSASKVRCNQIDIVDFSKIRGVRAWSRGSRFYVALQVRYGQTVRLGHFAFSRSERAWREDAAQIAAFLGVPLEIPPVLD